jgi:hypothetical protein
MNRTCHFPRVIRDPASFSFCGEPVARPELPYCVEHMRRAYLRSVRRQVLRSVPRPPPNASPTQASPLTGCAATG